MKRTSFSLLLAALLCALPARAVKWVQDSVLGAGFEVHRVDMPDDYSGHVRSTVIRHRSDCGDSLGVLYVHGYNDYFFQDEEADRWADSCVHFYAVDLRKYGRSILPGQTPTEARDISEYYADIDSALAAMRADGVKHAVLMGHSTGGLVTSSYMSNRPDSMIQALVLNSPFLEWNKSGFMRKIAIPAVGGLGKLFPRWKISQGSGESPYGQSLLKSRHGEWDFDTRWKTLEPQKVEASWLGAITRAQRDVRRGRIDVPVLLMHSDSSATGDTWTPQFQRADGVLNVEHMKKYGPMLGSDVTLDEIPDGMHDLFLSGETAREKAYGDLFAWLRKRGIRIGKR